jgi:putative transposase
VKRTIFWEFRASQEITDYLSDMQDAVRYSLQVAYRDASSDGAHSVPSPIQLRREIKDWFYSRFDYARHHVNPVCRVAVAMLRSYRKNHNGELRIPTVKTLAMRIDGELFKMIGDQLRITLQPGRYVWVQINTKNKHYKDYSRGEASELLLTDTRVCLTFVISRVNKPLGEKLVGCDLNFTSLDSTSAARLPKINLRSVRSEPLGRVTQIQNDFSRRRKMLQRHIKDSQKMRRKLTETRGRQSNRVRDVLHKLSTTMVKENPDTSFVFEKLIGIRSLGGRRKGSNRFRASLNRWPYRMYQSFIDYKSPSRTIYVSPRGTSSECPVCGGKLQHPTWTVSGCANCGVDYDRNRLASLAILLRGSRLCGQPFAVSADASWWQLRSEYLYAGGGPSAIRSGWTDVASAPNGNVYESRRS